MRVTPCGELSRERVPSSFPARDSAEKSLGGSLLGVGYGRVGRLWQRYFEFKVRGSRSTHKLLLRESSGGYSRVCLSVCRGQCRSTHSVGLTPVACGEICICVQMQIKSDKQVYPSSPPTPGRYGRQQPQTARRRPRVGVSIVAIQAGEHDPLAGLTGVAREKERQEVRTNKEGQKQTKRTGDGERSQWGRGTEWPPLFISQTSLYLPKLEPPGSSPVTHP